MPKSRRAIGSDLAKVDATTDEDIARQIAEDPDVAPELTDEWFDEAEVWRGDRYLGRGRDFRAGRPVGRPKGSGKKELVTLRLDRDVLAYFRAGGPGWQTRLNDTLQAVLAVSKRVITGPRRLKTDAATISKILGLVGDVLNAAEIKRALSSDAKTAGPRRRVVARRTLAKRRTASPDAPMGAPNYAEQRSEFAKKIGLRRGAGRRSTRAAAKK